MTYKVKQSFTAVALTGFIAILLTGCQSMMGIGTTPKAHTVLANTTSQANMGKIYFDPASNGVRVHGTVSGLEPNSVHAIHIHEKPDCSNKGEAAGGHFNPLQNPHGHPTALEVHSGELPNVVADASGVASLDFVNPRISLTGGEARSVYNHAIIVHANADDYVSQPSGNAGGRIACGIIS